MFGTKNASKRPSGKEYVAVDPNEAPDGCITVSSIGYCEDKHEVLLRGSWIEDCDLCCFGLSECPEFNCRGKFRKDKTDVYFIKVLENPDSL